jgi:hypothetical protein
MTVGTLVTANEFVATETRWPLLPTRVGSSMVEKRVRDHPCNTVPYKLMGKLLQKEMVQRGTPSPSRPTYVGRASARRDTLFGTCSSWNLEA